MAKITEQAIAEVRINDEQAADKLVKLKKRTGELLDVGDSLSKKQQLEKDLRTIEKEMKQTYNQSVNVKKILEDINETSFNRLSQAAKKLTADFRDGRISAQKYAEQIGPIDARMQELNRISRTGFIQQESGWKSIIGVAGKFAVGIGAA